MEDIENTTSSCGILNNTMYDPDHTLISTLNSIADTNNFCNQYNHNNGYNGLKLGQRIDIKYGSSTKQFYIVGFDTESSRYASDGTLYDNGYGICLIPVSGIGVYGAWNNSSSATPYIYSSIHTSILQTISSGLQSTLGSHLVNRKVLLGSSIDRSLENNITGVCTNGYTWTTAYCTLMSLYQYMGCGYYYVRNDLGVSAKYDILYDIYGIGEANYQLPIFSFDYYKWTAFGTKHWLRNIIYDNSDHIYKAFRLSSIGTGMKPNTVLVNINDSSLCDTMPLIYIR